MMFADDTTVIYNGFSAQEIKKYMFENIEKISSWLANRKLTLSYKKISFMFLTKQLFLFS